MHNYSYTKRAMADSWSTTTVKNAQKAHCATCSATKNEGKRHHLRQAARCPFFTPATPSGRGLERTKCKKNPKKNNKYLVVLKKMNNFVLEKAMKSSPWREKTRHGIDFQPKRWGNTPTTHINTSRRKPLSCQAWQSTLT